MSSPSRNVVFLPKQKCLVLRGTGHCCLFSLIEVKGRSPRRCPCRLFSMALRTRCNCFASFMLIVIMPLPIVPSLDGRTIRHFCLGEIRHYHFGRTPLSFCLGGSVISVGSDPLKRCRKRMYRCVRYLEPAVRIDLTTC